MSFIEMAFPGTLLFSLLLIYCLLGFGNAARATENGIRLTWDQTCGSVVLKREEGDREHTLAFAGASNEYIPICVLFPGPLRFCLL
ncbi:hypothetical protein COCON_G00020710 [Conger conger]|uniref:Uncharacterized protein n=1 Tax=Conger conger TaxID=82655 RepID=A0A9Q1DWS3_CONCO|nr:hypothetical protein COCON_G00020710 [Conger conger]